jgi:NADH dehydrogenase (ubiquinone) 1 beta subcomplex subunit 8
LNAGGISLIFLMNFNKFYFTSTAWNKEWLPSKRPKTQEEREAAAKKYGLLPQDYEPYPDDGHGVGDYPKLPDIGGDSRSDWEDYDMPTLKRNYQEPVR